MAQDFQTPEALPPGTRLGQDFTILRVLGQGGFGITYLARDEMMGEVVVIKENMPAEFAMRDRDSRTISARPNREEIYDWARERFLDEASLLHKLHHPNIVPVTRAFSALNTAYYVMPHVGATELDTAVRNAPNGRSEAYLAPLLRQLLDALAYLHAQNLLHRDLKPANILMTAEGTPIIIDFGAARAVVCSHTQTMLESPGYTPYEQVMTHGKVGPWTDLYSLGATFYKLITGSLPPRGIDRLEDDSLYHPLASRRELQDRFSRRFLTAIDKALEIRPVHRWQTAEDWVNELPAPRPTTKFKNKISTTGTAAPTTVPFTAPAHQFLPNKLWIGISAVLTLLVLVLVGYIFITQHDQQRTAQQQTYVEGHPRQQTPQAPVKQNSTHTLSTTLLWAIKHNDDIASVAFSPDGKYLATGSADKTARITEVATGNTVREIEHGGIVYGIAFSPDGKYLATGSEDKTARITEVATGATIREIKHSKDIASVAFSPNGKFLATGSYDQTARITEIASGRTVREIKHGDSLSSVAFSPDGRYLATGSEDKTACITEVATGATIREIKHSEDIVSVAFSSDGKFLATGSVDDTARITEVATGRIVQEIKHGDWVTSVAFSTDGKYLATTGSADKTARITEVATGRNIREIKHNAWVWSVAFSTDGKFLATGSWDKTARIYELK